MTQLGAVFDRQSPTLPLCTAEDGPARLRRIFDDQFSFVWRYLRRTGLSEADSDDATQQVFVVAARKLDDIAPGKERAFLCGTACRVASETRRRESRRREHADDGVDEREGGGLRPDDVADRQRARAVLDRTLSAMPAELRSVFVLFELEEMSTADIAAALSLPIGTVASRLRRARESFRSIVARLRADGTIPGGSHD